MLSTFIISKDSSAILTAIKKEKITEVAAK